MEIISIRIEDKEVQAALGRLQTKLGDTRVLMTKIEAGSSPRIRGTAEAKDGWLESWTMVPMGQGTYLNKQRAGKLVYSRKQKD